MSSDRPDQSLCAFDKGMDAVKLGLKCSIYKDVVNNVEAQWGGKSLKAYAPPGSSHKFPGTLATQCDKIRIRAFDEGGVTVEDVFGLDR